MSREPKQYALADLVENPGLVLAMRQRGADRRLIQLLLELRPLVGQKRPLEQHFPG